MDRVIQFSTERITNPYGNGHNGIDLGYRKDEEMNKVYANSDGEVVEVQRNQPHTPGSRTWGNYVLVKHTNGWYSRYCHLQNNIRVNVGDKVNSSTWMAVIGDSGDAEYRHLHYEVSTGYDTSTRIDPTPYLSTPISPEKHYTVKYRSHVQGVGWQTWVGDGETSGTTGRVLRLEALQIDAPFEIEAKAHIEGIGWKDYGKINKDTVIGTTGQCKRLECLCFKGNFKYRIHIRNTGWTCWTKADGICTLGSVGQELPIEAIEILKI
jgi:hypothetical protein